MDQKEFTELIKKSREYLLEQQEIIKEKYNLDDYEQMDYEQESREMVFTLKGDKKVIMSFHVVGSVSDRSNTWMWSWDNPYLLDNVKEEMFKVKAFGEKHGIEKLIQSKWPGNEDDGWAMTAIASHILKSKGAFSFISEEMMVFVVFSKIRWG